MEQMKNYLPLWDLIIPTSKSLLHILVENQLAAYYILPLSDKVPNVTYT